MPQTMPTMPGAQPPTTTAGTGPANAGPPPVAFDASADGRASEPSADADAGSEDAAAGTLDGAVATPLDATIDAAEVLELPEGVPDALRTMFPFPGAQGVCPDPPLRLGFEAPPTLGGRGELAVFEVGASQPVARVTLGGRGRTVARGGRDFAVERFAYVDGNDAVFYLPDGMLAPDTRYYVSLSEGALLAPDGSTVIFEDPELWTFRTAAEVSGARSSLRVAHSDQADYCSLQAALDSVPDNNSQPLEIALAAGVYHGIVYFRGKREVTIRGAGRGLSVLSGQNNDNQNPGTAARALIGGDQNSDLSFEALTIHNTTPQGGSQAEALRLQNCDRCIVRDAEIRSLQDTVLLSGRLYVVDSLISGNVDFIWGTGTVMFRDCEIHTAGRRGYVVQSRNPPGSYGYVFVDSKLTSDPGITGSVLARIDVGVYPASHVAFVDCEMGSHISPEGFLVTGFGSTGQLGFMEYGSVDPQGRPIDVSRRAAGTKQMSAQQAEAMRDPTVVFAGWNPDP